MELRYRTAVVTGAGDEPGREVAERLARAGCAVLAADGDLVAAQETARRAATHRVWASAVQADVREEHDVRLLAARVHDLGGAHVVADTVGGAYAALLAELLEPLLHTRSMTLDAEAIRACSGAEVIARLRSA